MMGLACKFDELEMPETSVEREARQMKPLIARLIAFRCPSLMKRDDGPEAYAGAKWATPSRHWKARALVAWFIGLLVFGAAFAILMLLWQHSERKYDDYWYYTYFWLLGWMSFYAWAGRRDRHKRLKPSPFFFWFTGR
jgi:hypothetical protein